MGIGSLSGVFDTTVDVNNGQSTETFEQLGDAEYDVDASSSADNDFSTDSDTVLTQGDLANTQDTESDADTVTFSHDVTTNGFDLSELTCHMPFAVSDSGNNSGYDVLVDVEDSQGNTVAEVTSADNLGGGSSNDGTVLTWTPPSRSETYTVKIWHTGGDVDARHITHGVYITAPNAVTPQTTLTVNSITQA